jgi:hypothetical protein
MPTGQPTGHICTYQPTDRSVSIEDGSNVVGIGSGSQWPFHPRRWTVRPSVPLEERGRTKHRRGSVDRGLLMVPRQLSTLPRPSGGNWNHGAIDACLRSSSVMMQRPCKFLLFLPLGKVFYSCAVSVSPRGKDVGQHCPWPSPSVVHLRYVFQPMVMAKVPPGIL